MDDLSCAFDEDLLKELECSGCMEYMVPPIKLCTNGHNICSTCRETVQCCPTCRAEFSDIRILPLENIVRRQKYPCANRTSGCSESFSIEHIADYQAVCVYGKIKCPFHIVHTCSWKGTKSDLKEHAKTKHTQNFIETSSLNSKNLSSSFRILSCYGELFNCYKLIRDGTLYCAVQMIGTSTEASKYKCKFKLREENGIEQVSKTFLVRRFGKSSNTGIWLCLDKVTLREFVTGNKLNLTVKLSRV
jgi:hypothetical protein